MSNIDEHEEEISELEQTLRDASEFVFNTGLYASNSISLTSLSTKENPLPIMTDWGDGTINSNLTHSYNKRGTYVVRTFATIGENTNAMVCLKRVNKLHSMKYHIKNIRDIIKCENLVYANFSNISLEYDSDNLDGLFMNHGLLQEINLANWNTDGIVSLNNIFNGCKSLVSVNFDMWDTSNITDMSYMFSDCKSLNKLVLDFDTTNVTNMSYMFYNCSSLSSLTLSNWDFKNKLKYMWNTTNVTNMSYMFYNCTSLDYLDISNWNTVNVNTCTNMLYGVPKLSKTKWNYDGENYKDFLLTEYQTGYCDTFPWSFIVIYTTKETRYKTVNDLKDKYIPKLQGQYPEDYDIFLILNDGSITHDLNTYTAAIDKIKIRAIQTTEKINFSNTYITTLEKITTKKLIDMSYMFSSCHYLLELDLSDWIVSNITDMNHMFSDCINLRDINLLNWDTTNISDMSYMFSDCKSLVNLDIVSFNIEQADTQKMFLNIPEISAFNWQYDGDDSCKNIESLSEFTTGYNFIFPWNKFMVEYNIKATNDYHTISYQYDITKSSYLPIIDGFLPTDKNVILTLKDETTTNDLNTLAKDVSIIKVFYPTTTYSVKFDGYDEENCCFLSHIGSFDITPLRTGNSMFRNCIYLESIDLSNWIVSNIIDMSYMFSGCINLKDINLEDWNTVRVTNMSHMFSKCSALEILDLSSFNTANVKDMSNMFNYCNSLINLITTSYDQFGHRKIKWWDTSSLENMQFIFADCCNLSDLDVSDWITDKIDNIQHVFYECEKLVSLDLSKWNIDNITNMDSVFKGCESLKELNIDGWNTSNVTTMHGLFENCRMLSNIDVANFNTSLLVNGSNIFKNCISLESLDLSKWDVSNLAYMREMFSECFLLKDLNLSTWNTSNVEDTYLSFNNVVIDDWHYDKTNYNNFILTELDCNYSKIFPWSDMGYIEYKIIRRNVYSDCITAGSNHIDHRYYLPRLYTSLDSYFYPTINDKFIILKLFDGTETNNLNTDLSEIESIRIEFNKKSIKAIKFYNSDIDYCCVKELVGLNTQLKDMSNMFRNCIYLEKVNLLECDLKDTLNISNIFFNCNSIEYIETNYDEDVISNIDYSHNFPYNKIKGVK